MLYHNNCFAAQAREMVVDWNADFLISKMAAHVNTETANGKISQKTNRILIFDMSTL